MTFTLRAWPSRVLFAIALLGASRLSAQQKSVKPADVDRTLIPTAGAMPELRVPTWTKTTLTNGTELVVSVRSGLPLVSFQLNFVGGANQYEPSDKTGLANIVANMLSEGTTHRTGDQLSRDVQLLGTSIGVEIGRESGGIAFSSTKDKFAPTLAIVADLLENPTFPQASLDRLKGRTIVALTQSRDRTAGIAGVVFPKVLYGADSPLGRAASEKSISSITRDDVASFYKSYVRPGHALITVVGDVNAADVRRVLDNALSDWNTGGSMPAFTYPPPAASAPTTIYLVDKPTAAQSTFALGEVGPSRATPDYYALRVMNEILGVLFQSRLNHNIREVKGYSYGVGSNFAFGRGPGAFQAGGDIVTDKSDSALIEFVKELRDIRGAVPPTDEEMQQAKAALVQSLPASFASVSGVNADIASIFVQGLPEDFYQQFARAIDAVTRDDVIRVARKYIDPDHLSIVIVGDRAKIEGPLAATKIAPVVILNANGDPVPSKITP